MEWIRDEGRPEIIEQLETYGKSKKVLVLIEGKEPLVAEYNSGIENGEKWEQWYCPGYEDAVEGVTAWCDCIPKI
jgi:hypothetical protein